MKSLISEIKAKIVLTVIILLLSLTVVYKLIVPTQEFWIQAASVVPIFSLFYYYMKIQHRKYKVLKDFTGHKNIIQVWVWRWNDNIVEEKRWYLRKMFEKIFQDFYNSRPEGYSHDYDCLADIVKFSNKLRDYYKLILNDKQEYLSTLSLEEVLNLKNLFIINFENQVVVRIVENFKEYTTEELIKMVKVVPPVENKAVYRIFEEQVMKRKWREDMSQEEKRNTGRQIID